MRSLLKAPRFTAVVVVTLALGVGANSAIFSVVDAVLLEPLPFPDAGKVVNLAWDGSGYVQSHLSPVKFEYWREHARSLAGVATWRAFSGQLDERTGTSDVRALQVSHDFLEVLGFTPALGRGFTAAADTPGGSSVAVISHTTWQTRFGGSADVLGRTIRLNAEPFTVVGVLPNSFAFPYEDGPVEMIVPLGLTIDPSVVAEDWPALARLRDGFTRAQAETDVASLLEAFQAAYPNQVGEQDRGMRLASFAELYVPGGVRRTLWILSGAVALVLLIACANVAHLFLARGVRRRGEIARRAGRESRAHRAFVGLLLGAAGAAGLSRIVSAYVWGVTPTDPVTFAAVGGILLAVALAASWIPAHEAAQLNPVDTLNSE